MSRTVPDLIGTEFADQQAGVLRRQAEWERRYGARLPTAEECRACPDLARAVPPNALAERNPERLSLATLLRRDGVGR